MKTGHVKIVCAFTLALIQPVQAQSPHEELLCEAAKSNQVVELVYDKDVSKGCLPRIIDVHQVGIGNNGKLYMHGWQTRGCTKGKDFASKRIFRFDKIQAVDLIDDEFSEESQAVKAEGWDGCIVNNCFIKENICE